LDAINAAIAAAVPVGVVLPYAGQHDNLPTGWLLCDGSQVSRTQYSQLFNVLGVTHGGGDGTTTFHLPDYRGRFLRGVDRGAGRDPDRASRIAPQASNTNGTGLSGDLVGSVQGGATRLPNAAFTTSNPGNHVHGYADNSGWICAGTPTQTDSFTCAESGLRSDVNRDSGGGGSHTHTLGGGDNDTRPANANVAYIIKGI
jgi:phage-related tail fiber protein